MKRSLSWVLLGLALVPAAAAASCGGGDTGSGGGAQGGGGSGVAGGFPSSSQSSSSTGGLGGFASTGGGSNAGGTSQATGGGAQGGSGQGGAGGVAGTGGGGGMPMLCQDGVMDGAETDVDCGGGTCPTCVLGKTCAIGADCASGTCTSGVCATPVSCTDGIRNGTETGIDCGGGVCPKCADGKACNDGTDCQSGSCADGTCVAPNCFDGAKNGNETDVDCGGDTCSPCALGQACQVGGDCTSGHCVGGACVACVVASDCSGTTDDCQHPACNSNACSAAFTMAGTAIMQQTPGDCHVVVCDGMGGTTSQVDDMDAPSDNNACTNDICTNGTASHPPSAVGAPCSQGGSICDGSGVCTDLRVMVVRVGDGSAALSSASAPVFVEEWPFSGAETRTIALPIAASGTNQPFSLAGTGTSEGALSLSADGHFVTLGGYATAPGIAAVAGTTGTAVNRLVARIDATGNVDTSTTLGTAAFSSNAIRGATSTDGTSIWATGNGSAGGGGAWHVGFGAPASAAQIDNGPANMRCTGIFGAQLFGSSGSGAFVNVFTIGSGLPTTSGQASTSLPGLPITGASPYGFALLDRLTTVAGLDTLYISEDGAVGNMTNPGGVQRWTFDGTTWTRTAVFNGGLASGVRGVTAQVVGNSVVILATTAETSANHLVAFIDDGIVTTGTAIVIATAPTNEFYRGVALSPR